MFEFWKATFSFGISVCPSVRPSARPHGRTPLPLDGFSWNFVFEYYSKICQENPRFHQNPTRITGNLREKLCTFMIISPWVLRIRNVSDKSCRENQNAHFMFTNSFPENSAVCWIMWRKCCRARHTTDSNIIRRMRIARWITKATDTYSEYVILLFSGSSCYANAPQCYVIRTLPVLLNRKIFL
jgi:hypothetical protein